MQAISFYLLYPIIFLIASLPFRLLYVISDILCLLFWNSGYRREVVLANLKKSFPEKSESEILSLARSYYQYLCDIMLETLKAMRMSEQEMRERCVFHQTDWLTKMYEQKKSVIFVLGHYGNWEWGGLAFSLSSSYQLNIVYRPLSNPFFDRMITRMRTRFGARVTPAHQTMRDVVVNRNQTTAITLVADQAAITNNVHWTTFLNQDTDVYNGPEKLAVKFNYPVVFMNIKRLKRGYYGRDP